jgi:hypothetical protein
MFYVVVEMKFCGVKDRCTMLRCAGEGRARVAERAVGLESWYGLVGFSRWVVWCVAQHTRDRLRYSKRRMRMEC